MGKLQNMLTAVLPDAWMAAMETESREWAMRCPCGHETTVWEMGGIRFKAAGNPRRVGMCAACGRTFWGQVYLRSQVRQNGDRSIPEIPLGQTRLSGEAMSSTMKSSGNPVGTSSLLLWIDGVGCWSVVQRSRFTIGGPPLSRRGSAPADLALLADLSSQHASITREGESYIFEANGPAQVDSVPYTSRLALANGHTIRLGNAVQLRFLQPSALSGTARIEFISGHRPARRIDGVILLEQACILGPGAACHIVCPDWPGEVVLFRRDGRLWVKQREGLFVNGCRATGDVSLRDGTVVSSEDLRLRVESERS